eukprot:TRINITY_DN777954_c0_g1_i1.p1 TRINITY_DN777954_c0_g1~~TRINITY_DN777954_c0_g1_i1.p1  ORF type:complete len:296 (+),score=51.77 TRINITY_DN777954_c0_g1_i1:74-961(+)
MPKVQKKSQLKLVSGQWLCGAAAGMAAKTFVAPLDRTMIISQVKTGKFSVESYLRTCRGILANEGVLKLWRGNMATLARVIPYAGVSFMSHDFYKRYFSKLLNKPESELPSQIRFIAGSMAGASAVVATYPLDFMRANVSLPEASASKVGRMYMSTASATLAKSGVMGFYKGITPTLLGIVPYAGLGFFSFETLKHWTLRKFNRDTLSPGLSFACGTMSGWIAQSIPYPLDVIRRRMQCANAGPMKMSTVIKSLLMENGVRGLWKGVTLNIIRGPVQSGVSFMCYEFLKTHFKWS